jgi:cellulose synthase/poly-beta-1,6-N-acetylglucosamine synthase-like glycosyltransferase
VTTLLGIPLLLLAVGLAIPCLVLFVECMAALVPGRDLEAPEGPRPTTAVIIPAHDEELGIGATVAALLPDLGPGDRLIVVADNCRDGTAAAARAAGATVIERSDPERRGKGFALVFALDHLAANNPPEVVVIVDADCRLSPGGLAVLARRAAETDRPVQGDYVLAAPPDTSARGALSALAVLVRNRVRPLGMRRLGLPCQLTGSGMAFPFEVMRAAPHLGANLVEDLVMGLELALAGHPPLGCPEVSVTSELPEGDDAAIKQRRRWEHGQLATLRQYGPRLVMAGLARADRDLLGLGLDLCVPPLALLALMLLASWAVCAAAAVLLGAPLAALWVLTAALVAVILSVVASWWRFGRATLPLRALLAIPVYVLWKIPLYLGLLVRGRHKSWDRTQRKGEGDKDPP